MSRVNATFKRLRWEKEAALIPTVTVGQPSFDITRQIVPLMTRQGADLVILSQAAGSTLMDCFNVVSDIRRANDAPLVFRWYPAWLGSFTPQEFVQMCAGAGFDGLWGDQQADNAVEIRRACEAAGIHMIAAVKPRMTLEEVHRELDGASGFVICSFNPPAETGSEDRAAQVATDLVRELRELTQLPLVLSVATDTAQHVALASRIADGVIVGTSLASLLSSLPEDDIIPAVGEYIREFKAATLSRDE